MDKAPTALREALAGDEKRKVLTPRLIEGWISSSHPELVRQCRTNSDAPPRSRVAAWK